jgi:hypothetical protein
MRNAFDAGTASEALVRRIALEPQQESPGAPMAVPETVAGADASDVADYWFRRYLESEIPELRSTSRTDWQNVNAIRQWAYENIPRAASSDMLLEHKYGYSVYNFHPRDVLFLISNNEGGYYCGGTAELLAGIYRSLGYKSHTYNMGQREGAVSHVTTLVEIEFRGRAVTSVQDAYFNFALERNGEPVSFDEILDSLESGDTSAISFQTRRTGCKPVVSARTQESGSQTSSQGHEIRSSASSANSSVNGTRNCHSFSLGTLPELSVYEDWLEAQIGRRNILNLFLFPLGTRGGPEGEELGRKAEQVRRQLIDAMAERN